MYAVPLARKLNAPLLLTPPDQLPDEVLNEIKLLGAKTVIIMGGTGAISQSVSDTLTTQLPNITVQRIAGIDRYETAYLTAKRLGSLGEAVIVSGSDDAFADTLSISSWAAYHEVPILYADEGGASQLPLVTVNALQDLKVTKTLLVGGTSVLPQALQSLLPNPVRYGGVDRFTTNARILGELQPNPTSIFVATGNNFADALAGAVVAGQINAWLLLTDINSEQARLLESAKGGVLDFHVFGGPGAVSDRALSDIKELLGR